MPAGSIVIDLLMRTGSFETDTGRAAKTAKKAAKDIQRSFDDLNRSLKATFATITGGLGVAGLVQIARATLEGVDAMNDLSDATGASVENISALDDIARRTGTNLDTVSSILIRFNAALDDAGSNKEIGAVFKALNLDIDQLKKLDPAEALRRTADAFDSFANSGSKARAEQVLFGKLTGQAAPFLKDLAEAGKLNATVTRQQSDAVDAFNKQIYSLQTDIVQLARTLLVDLVPSMSASIREFKTGIDVFGSIGSALANIGLGPTFKTNLDALQAYRYMLSNVQELQKAAAQQNFLGRGLNLLGADKEKLAEQEQTIRKFIAYYEKLLGLTDVKGGRGNIVPPFAVQKDLKVVIPSKEKRPRESEADRYLESLQKQLQATRELTVTEKLLDDIQAGRLGKVSAQQQQALVGVARQIDAAKAAAQAWEDEKKAVVDAFKADGERREALTREAAAVFEATRTPAEQLAAEIARLNALLDAGVISWDTYARAQFAAQDAFDEAAKKAKQAADELDEFAKNAAENIQRSLGDTLVDAMNGNWKSIGDGFKQMLDRMIAEALAANITRALFGEAGKGGGLLGDLLPALGSFLGFGGARAGGGSVDSGRAYLVGEQGPELFVPRTAGRVYSAPQTAASGAGGMQVQQTFVVQGTPDRRTQAQLAAAAAQGLARAASRMN